MEQRPLGSTGLTVSALGLGAGRIGDAGSSDALVDALVGRALDLGVTLIDTARSYGASEERLGRALQGRRERVVLSTKVGYGVEGVPDWTAACIEQGVERALRTLRTDRLEVVHLHSCPREVLEQGGVVEALARAVRQGKVRVAAYSGENDALDWAVRSGAFGAVQCSVSVVDQGALESAVAEASTRGLGVLGKRALGNAPWRLRERPRESDVAEAWDRFGALGLDGARAAAESGEGLDWAALFTRFAAHAPGVSTILIGTASPEHLEHAAAALARGPLDAATRSAVRAAWAREGAHWRGRI